MFLIKKWKKGKDILSTASKMFWGIRGKSRVKGQIKRPGRLTKYGVSPPAYSIIKRLETIPSHD